MFKSTEKYNIYTSEDKNNTTFIAVINKQNNRLMCAYTHTVVGGIASGIAIEILSNGPISRYEKYVGKFNKHQLVFDESIGEFIVNAEDSGVNFRIMLDHANKSYTSILNWFHEITPVKINTSNEIKWEIKWENNDTCVTTYAFNAFTADIKFIYQIKYTDNKFIIHINKSEAILNISEDIAKHYLPLNECVITYDYADKTLCNINIYPITSITHISDPNSEVTSKASEYDNIEAKITLPEVNINFMKYKSDYM